MNPVVSASDGFLAELFFGVALTVPAVTLTVLYINAVTRIARRASRAPQVAPE